MPPVDKARLLSRFQASEETALEELIELYKAPLHRFIYRYVNDPGEAEDILSITFVKAWRNRRQVRPTDQVQTWLYTIATNLCRDHARRQRRHPSDFSALQQQFDEREHASFIEHSQTHNASDAVAHSEELKILRTAISTLPHDLKSALILCSIEGHSQMDAATLLNCSPKAIETRVYRAKQMLREHFSRFHC